ncbi:immunoglobulin superfamily member 2-like [Salarias fasciatus]|uniref:immunoglobulin superfamily member 2-like n=1 Tax=Salarias fasciatus TaxID=181472 RepID=UPI0011769F81|nr:immunoglobulin superfamily member 2-like [Salarias fasciatus]XP_029973098.1 immunoglobulin superfamily member 2-like [Salarias fasciatus]
MLWLSVLFLHRGYALAPVTSVHLGEPANISCALPFAEVSRMELHWYRQRVGDKLQRIVTLWQSTTPKYEPEFSESRWEITVGGNLCNLTITKTVEEDEGTYHCAFVEWINTEWSATYLLVKGHSQRTSHFTVQQSMVSESIVLGEPVTFECSVLSENKVCSGDLSVFWLRGGSQASQPDVIYTDANSWDECGRRSDTQRSCVYRFSKTLTSSDAGIYYCAVATCGQIVFGNGTEMDFKVSGSSSWSQEVYTVIFLLCGVLAVSLTVTVFLIYAIMKTTCEHCKASNNVEMHSGDWRSQQNDEATWIYSAAVFTIMKHRKGSNRLQKAAEREKIFTAVKAFGLDQ